MSGPAKPRPLSGTTHNLPTTPRPHHRSSRLVHPLRTSLETQGDRYNFLARCSSAWCHSDAFPSLRGVLLECQPAMARAPASTFRRGTLVLLVALIVAVAGGGSPAAACRCIGRPPPVADALGTVRFAARVRVTGAPTTGPLTRSWSATVVAAYRGCFPATIKLVSPLNTCGVRMAAGTELLLLPRPRKVEGAGVFKVAECDWSRSWASLKPADHAALGRASDLVCPAHRPRYY